MLILFQSQALQEPDDAIFTYEPGMRLVKLFQKLLFWSIIPIIISNFQVWNITKKGASLQTGYQIPVVFGTENEQERNYIYYWFKYILPVNSTTKVIIRWPTVAHKCTPNAKRHS